MFEQATLNNGPAGKRVWAALLGVTSQVALVTGAIMAPLVWPQALPLAHFWETLTPPVPQGQPVKPASDPERLVRTTMPVRTTEGLLRFQPKFVPLDVVMLDEAPNQDTVVGAPTGNRPGPFNDVLGAVLHNAADNIALARPPAPAERPAAHTTEPAHEVIQRYHQGGNVHLGKPLQKVDPTYPATARVAHIAGDVILECVVGADGHMREISVKGGSPLLARAAVDAVRQWVYEPSRLNGEPIEIATVITITFRLN